MPNIERIRQRGIDDAIAAAEMHVFASNPYKPHQVEYEAWADGHHLGLLEVRQARFAANDNGSNDVIHVNHFATPEGIFMFSEG